MAKLRLNLKLSACERRTQADATYLCDTDLALTIGSRARARASRKQVGGQVNVTRAVRGALRPLAQVSKLERAIARSPKVQIACFGADINCIRQMSSSLCSQQTLAACDWLLAFDARDSHVCSLVELAEQLGSGSGRIDGGCSSLDAQSDGLQRNLGTVRSAAAALISPASAD